MDHLDSFRASLQAIQQETEILSSASASLSETFAAESVRLSREDMGRRLQSIRASISRDLAQLAEEESTASYVNSKWRFGCSIAGLFAKGIVTAATENRKTRNLVNRLVDDTTGPKRTYGTLMVCVGPKGLPDDVQAASISELSRKFALAESEVVRRLQDKDYLLFREEDFSRLTDKLINEIREGQLSLPVSHEKLMAFTPVYGELETRRTRWVASPQPPRYRLAQQS